MQRFITFVLLFYLIVSVQGNAFASFFPDVTDSHINFDAIAYVQQNGIVDGYPDGTYRPDVTINRAEFTKIIVSAIVDDEEIHTCDLSIIEYLSDVDPQTWYAPYICVAKMRGIITGHLPSSGTPYFAPAESINTIEAAKIITAGFGIGEPPMDCLADWGRACIEAARRGEHWYDRHIQVLTEMHAMPLSVRTLQYHYITRAEMAEMIYRLKAKVTDLPSRTFEELSFAEGWYINDSHKFEIAWPSQWGIFSRSEDHVSFGNIQNFGKDGYDGEWFVFVLDVGKKSKFTGNEPASMNAIARNMGSQFADRREDRDAVIVNGLPATRITVTTPSLPGWKYESVITEYNNTLYWIHNGATQSSGFVNFYNTFRLLNT